MKICIDTKDMESYEYLSEIEIGIIVKTAYLYAKTNKFPDIDKRLMPFLLPYIKSIDKQREISKKRAIAGSVKKNFGNQNAKKTLLNSEIQKPRTVSRQVSKQDCGKNIPPKIEDVRAYIQEKGYLIDPEKFWNFYNCKGWMVGKTKMQNWHSAVATWVKSPNKKDDSSSMKRNALDLFSNIYINGNKPTETIDADYAVITE